MKVDNMIGIMLLTGISALFIIGIISLIMDSLTVDNEPEEIHHTQSVVNYNRLNIYNDYEEYNDLINEDGQG